MNSSLFLIKEQASKETEGKQSRLRKHLCIQLKDNIKGLTKDIQNIFLQTIFLVMVVEVLSNISLQRLLLVMNWIGPFDICFLNLLIRNSNNGWIKIKRMLCTITDYR